MYTYHEHKMTQYLGGDTITMTKTIVTGSHEVSVLKNIYYHDEISVVKRLKKNEVVMVDTSMVHFDWQNNEYYKCDIGKDFDCFIPVGGAKNSA